MPISINHQGVQVPLTTTNPVTIGTDNGQDKMLISRSFILQSGLPAGTTQVLCNWSSGNISDLHQYSLRVAGSGETVPLGLAAQNTHATVTHTSTNITVAVPAAGIPWPPFTVLSLLLEISY